MLKGKVESEMDGSSRTRTAVDEIRAFLVELRGTSLGFQWNLGEIGLLALYCVVK